MKHLNIFIVFTIVIIGLPLAYALEVKPYEEYFADEVIGEVFSQPIAKSEFDYYYKTAVLFTRGAQKG